MISNPISNPGDKNQGKKRYFMAKKNPSSEKENRAFWFLGTHLIITNFAYMAINFPDY